MNESIAKIRADKQGILAKAEEALALLKDGGEATAAQARQILRTFFESNSPRSFDISHTAGKDNMKYALGTLKAGGESYSVTIFVSHKGKFFKIQQLKIESQ